MSTVSTDTAGNIEIFLDKLSIEEGSHIVAITIGSLERLKFNSSGCNVR